MKYPKWYKAWQVNMTIKDILGSIPADPKSLEIMQRIRTKRGKAKIEEVKEEMDIAPETAEHMITESIKHLFRRDDKGIYLTQGQIIGWFEETIKACNLRRKIRNVPLTFFVDPTRIYLNKKTVDREVVRTIKGWTPQGYINALHKSEAINRINITFNLLSTNLNIKDEVITQLMDVGKRIGIGPGRHHGYGEITNLICKKIQ